MKRCLAALICLLYLSISTVFASGHHHSSSEAQEHCQVCAWHQSSTVDAPETQVRITLPVFQLVTCEQPFTVHFEIFLAEQHSRGPPQFPLS
jgi:hypothetical protein